MADKIKVSTECLERCARKLDNIGSELTQLRRQLRAVDTDRASGGDLRLNFSWASNVREAVSVLGANMSDIQREAEAASRAVSRASGLFADAEKQIAQSIKAMDDGDNQNSGNQAAALGANGGPSMFVNQRPTPFPHTNRPSPFPFTNRPSRIPNKWQSFMEGIKREKARQLERANKATVYNENLHNVRQYGGNQSSPKTKKSEYDTYIKILERNRGVKLTHRQMKTYLEKLETMACPYVALANTVFQHYEGNAEGFERDYGFPMYKDGALNYDQLIVEFYTKADNVTSVNNGKPVYDSNEDYQGFWKDGIEHFYNEFKDNSDVGVPTDNTLETRLNYCLGDKGTVTRYGRNEITVQNYSEYAEKGSVIISIAGQNACIYDLNNNKVNIGGHSMSIVGVEGDRFVVSSWGQKYYLDPADNPAILIYDVVTFN